MGFLLFLFLVSCSTLNNNCEIDPIEQPVDTNLCMNFQEAVNLQMPVETQNSLDSLEGLVKLDIFKVANPDRYPIQVEIFLSEESNLSPIAVGVYSLFPVDNPGNYIFDLNQYISDKDKWGSLNIILILKEIQTEIDNSQVEICIKPIFIT